MSSTIPTTTAANTFSDKESGSGERKGEEEEEGEEESLPPSTAAVFDRLTMGLVRTLERRLGVVEVRLASGHPPATSAALAALHARMPDKARLPQDAQAFYRSSDGLTLAWSVLMRNGEAVPLGRIHLNRLANLRLLEEEEAGTTGASAKKISANSTNSNSAMIETLRAVAEVRHAAGRASDISSQPEHGADGPQAVAGIGRAAAGVSRACVVSRPEDGADGRMEGESEMMVMYAQEAPSDNGRPCPALLLDDCMGEAQVVLVLRSGGRGQVWLRDAALAWHFLAGSFTEYYRLMTLHLGLPGWQFCLTQHGPPSATAAWFHLFAPLRLAVDMRLAAASRATTDAVRRGRTSAMGGSSAAAAAQTTEKGGRRRQGEASDDRMDSARRPTLEHGGSRLNLGKVLRHVNNVAREKSAGEQPPARAGGKKEADEAARGSLSRPARSARARSSVGGGGSRR